MQRAFLCIFLASFPTIKSIWSPALICIHRHSTSRSTAYLLSEYLPAVLARRRCISTMICFFSSPSNPMTGVLVPLVTNRRPLYYHTTTTKHYDTRCLLLTLLLAIAFRCSVFLLSFSLRASLVFVSSF